jgi:hypothetical protein
MRPLLHIGYHKTGTTWLQRNVFPDEGMGFAYVGDPRAVLSAFFVNPFDFRAEVAWRGFRPRIERAEERGLLPVISHERLSGSPYAGGHDSRAVADRLAETFPDARILVAIREQKSMILSVYKQYLGFGGAASLEQFLKAPAGINRSPVFRHNFFEYHRLIGYYRSLFGAGNVLALPYEILRSRPADFLGRITGFLDLPDAVPPPGRDNISPSALSLSLKRRANRFVVRDALNPAPLFERPNINRRMNRACKRFDAAAPPHLLKRYEARWRDYIERQVGDRYAESNAATSRMIGLDLKTLGYA